MIFKKKESTQELLGIEAITDYGISTKQGELVFFSVAPTNLSVLPADSIDARINALLNIIRNATNKNKLSRANTNDTKQMITAEGNLQDVFEMVNAMRKKREPLIHCAVFIELCAPTMQELERLQSEVISELLRSKLNADRLRLRQQKGYLSACPQGHNIFGTQFERVLPASSVANLYIYNYSGKTDAHGFYIGKDRYGSNILTDFDRRDEDKTSANVLILGNSGQGKSYLIPPHQFLFNAGSIDSTGSLDPTMVKAVFFSLCFGYVGLVDSDTVYFLRLREHARHKAERVKLYPFVVRPHTEDFYCLRIFNDFIHQSVLRIDSAGV